MGSCCFGKSPTKPTSRPTIRVVHLDGFLEDYDGPITVERVINGLPKHFLTTTIQLMQKGLVPLKPEMQLEPGRIYFVLPYSILRFNESSVDLICLTKKLTRIAKTRQHTPKPAPTLVSPQDNGSGQVSGLLSCNDGKGTVRNSTKGLSWKPILATIREISFNRRSESDLHD